MASLGYCAGCNWLTVILNGHCLWCKGAVTASDEAEIDALEHDCGCG